MTLSTEQLLDDLTEIDAWQDQIVQQPYADALWRAVQTARLLADRPLTLAALQAGAEEVGSVWLCFDVDEDGEPVLTTAGGPHVCYFTGGAHHPFCGEFVLLPREDT